MSYNYGNGSMLAFTFQAIRIPKRNRTRSAGTRPQRSVDRASRRRRFGRGITGMLVQMGRMGGLGVGYLLQFFGWGWVRGTA
jgi:hypothetical protein